MKKINKQNISCNTLDFKPSRSVKSVLGIVGLMALSSYSFAFNPDNNGNTGNNDPQSDGFQVKKEIVKSAPWFTVYRPANMGAAVKSKGAPLPVIAWANGGCFRSEFTWRPLFDRWAAEGYVVLALSKASKEDGEKNGFLAGSLQQTTVEHQGALIDWALNESSFGDKLATDKIIAAGNSCGGVTSLKLAAQDKRVTGVFVLSGSSALGSTNKRVMGNISVPVGYVVGGEEDVAGGPAKKDYAALTSSIPGMVVSRKSGAHREVSTTETTLEEVADISFHWMDLILNGNQASYDELNSNIVCSDCTPGDWSMMSKNLESLIQ